MDRQLTEILDILPLRVQTAISFAGVGITEVRLRVGRPAVLTTANGNLFLSLRGVASPVCNAPVVLIPDELRAIYLKLCRRSVYAREHELAEGYVTYSGCRAGICGEAVRDGDNVTGFRNITSINIRIAHEVKGAAAELVRQVIKDGRVKPTLIVAPPGGGKTTMLRDLARLLVVLALALIVNSSMQKQREELFTQTAKVNEQKILGEATLVDALGSESEGEVTVEVGSVSSRYFADARVSCQKARDAAIETLKAFWTALRPMTSPAGQPPPKSVQLPVLWIRRVQLKF